MGKATGRILKSGDVELQGQVRLDTTQTDPSLPKVRPVTSGTPEARIMENHPGFAIVEVTCSCGIKMSLRCEYADGQASADGSQTQNGTKAPNQEPDQTE